MKTYRAICYQRIDGTYLSLKESNDTELTLKAHSEEEAYIKLEERQGQDSELRIKDRWTVFEIEK